MSTSGCLPPPIGEPTCKLRGPVTPPHDPARRGRGLVISDNVLRGPWPSGISPSVISESRIARSRTDGSLFAGLRTGAGGISTEIIRFVENAVRQRARDRQRAFDCDSNGVNDPNRFGPGVDVSSASVSTAVSLRRAKVAEASSDWRELSSPSDRRDCELLTVRPRRSDGS